MGIVDFVNRHRNKFLLLGGAAGTLYIIKKILADQEKQWQRSSSHGFVCETRKKEIHFENVINECNQLCQRMCPKIIARLDELLDDSKLIENLSAKRSEKNVQSKVEIWKSLKVKILTRLLSEIYSICIMVCYMRVQMSVIGGQVFASNIGAFANNSSPTSATMADLANMKTCSKYIGLLGAFYDKRFDSIIQPIEEAVEEALRGFNLDYNIGIKDFRTILDKIKGSVSFFLHSAGANERVFLMDPDKLSTEDLATTCPESGPLSEADEAILRKMIAETHDILQSDDFKHVLDSSIDVGYALLLDVLLGSFIKIESKLSNKDKKPNFSNPNAIQVPLAKILPQIRSNYQERTEADQKALVNHLLCLDVLNCFASNVYDAFCVPK